MRRDTAAKAAEHAEELQAAVAATCAAEQQGAAAAEVAAQRLAHSERQLADSRRVAAAAQQQAAELQADMQDAEEQFQAAEAACNAARQQAADAERIAGQLRQQLSDGQLDAAALQQHLAAAMHGRDAACAELDAVRTAAALTDGALATSAAAAHGPAGAAPAEQRPAGTTPALTVFSPGLHNALAAADARLHGGWTLRRESSGSVTAAVWPIVPTGAASGDTVSSAPPSSTSAASPAIGGSSAAVSEAQAGSGSATPQDSASDDGDNAAFEPMSEGVPSQGAPTQVPVTAANTGVCTDLDLFLVATVRRKRLRLTPSKAAEAPASAGTPAHAQGGSSVMNDGAPSNAPRMLSEFDIVIHQWQGHPHSCDADCLLPTAMAFTQDYHMSMQMRSPVSGRTRRMRRPQAAGSAAALQGRLMPWPAHLEHLLPDLHCTGP
jgi:hypothetical protein